MAYNESKSSTVNPGKENNNWGRFTKRVFESRHCWYIMQVQILKISHDFLFITY